ncbi:hypothetical protein N836_33250 [Leptolyngbya sp. Heron Island J]|uniref:CIS tube protein n=1 Tax=Leptolyngbya sp. Heron Island J TaxID=1385935 RepID=UPI0003B9523A|nr:hypothetical protein [Leptolyngbya sp. Heron Island J]ESA38298.1 hypothetical protein N836_33250 [Leptolyngbya sp. Heron Island J]
MRREQRHPIRGFLVSVGLTPELLVEFQYNPSQLSDRRSVSYATLNAPGLIMPTRQYVSGGDRTLSFTVRIDGLMPGPMDKTINISRDADGGITPELNKYRTFLYPQSEQWQRAGGSFMPLYADTQQFASPPPCRLSLGNRVIDCIVTDVSITELYFNTQLAPLRADVAISLVELTPYNRPAPGGQVNARQA